MSLTSGSWGAGITPIEGLQEMGFGTNREIFSLPRLPASMIVLGRDPIAVEMAQAFCRLGTKVHVVQRSRQILSREDKDLADELMELLRLEGVIFHLASLQRKSSSHWGGIPIPRGLTSRISV